MGSGLIFHHFFLKNKQKYGIFSCLISYHKIFPPVVGLKKKECYGVTMMQKKDNLRLVDLWGKVNQKHGMN